MVPLVLANSTKISLQKFPAAMQTTAHSTITKSNAIGTVDGGVCFAYQNHIFLHCAHNTSVLFQGNWNAKNAFSWRHVKKCSSTIYLAAYSLVNNVVYFFGGRTTIGRELAENQLQILDLQTNTLKMDNAGKLPPARCAGTMVHRTIGNSLVLFGGFGEDFLLDVWEYKLEKGTWNCVDQVNTIHARSSHAMVYSASRDCLFVFAGAIRSLDTELVVHVFSFATREWSKFDDLPDYVLQTSVSAYRFDAHLLHANWVLLLGNEGGM